MAHGRIDDAWPCLLQYSKCLFVFLIACTAEEKQIQTPLDQNNDQTELPLGPNPLPVLPPVPGAPRPHIVLFVVDDMGWSNMGYHNDNARTPHFDREAAAGVKLERHYTFRWCAPTRAAFMTGRMPYHVLEGTNYVSGGMNMLPAKLKQVGYATHQIGKWHLGCLMDWMTPHGRGFDTSFGYLTGGEDHYTHTVGSSYFGCAGTDLYQTGAPAYGHNNTYGAYMYNDEAVRIIRAHDRTQPLFLYMATQVSHGPDQVPLHYSSQFPADQFTPDFAVYNGMVNAGDQMFGNLTAALRDAGMYNNTLIVMSSDNGGPASVYTSSKAANNFPLRGGKKTDFEGGIRVNSFVGGGFVPQSARGKTRSGYMHCADWYPTLCALGGGHDCRDTNTSLERSVPAVDGYDMWRYIVGEEDNSPRQEIMVARCEHPNQHKIPNSTYPCSGAYIRGDFKIITGIQYYGFWQGPRYPNATTNHSAFDHFVDCGSGCLFNIQDDPSEYNDLRSTHPDVLEDMRARLLAHNATQFDAPRAPKNGRECKAYRDAHHGYLGPYLVPTPPPPTPSGPFSLVLTVHNVERCMSSELQLVSCVNRSVAAVWYVGEDGPNEAALLTGNGSCLKIHETPGQKCEWSIAYMGICNHGPSTLNSFSLVNGTLRSFQCERRCVLSPQNEGSADSMGDQGQLSLGPCTETRAMGWSLR